MLTKAIAYYKEVGREAALAAFTGKRAPFFDRDLYVACIDQNHVVAANGAFPALVGSSADALKTADGQVLGVAGWKAVEDSGTGAVKYRWLNPATGKAEPKITFFAKVGTDICGVGAYDAD